MGKRCLLPKTIMSALVPLGFAALSFGFDSFDNDLYIE